MLLRLSLAVPIVLSAVSIGLGIALLAAGDKGGGGYYWLAVNTSNIGQDLIQLTPANTTNPGGGGSNSNSPIPDIFNPSGIFDGLGDAFNNVVDNITSEINNGVMDLQGQLIGSLTKQLGIKDIYILYLSKICEGKFTNPDVPGSPFEILECSKYSDSGQGLRNISASIPSSFALGRTNVSIPLVAALGTTVGTVVDLGTGGATALQVLSIIAVISIGLLLLGSLAAVLLLRRVTALVNMSLGILGSVTYLAAAVVTTVLVSVGGGALDGFGSTFGLGARQGKRFLAMVWIGAIFALFSTLYWIAVWFVEFRRSSFKRRRRTPHQIGNWRGILSEVWDDLRLRETSKIPQ